MATRAFRGVAFINLQTLRLLLASWTPDRLHHAAWAFRTSHVGTGDTHWWLVFGDWDARGFSVLGDTFESGAAVGKVAWVLIDGGVNSWTISLQDTFSLQISDVSLLARAPNTTHHQTVHQWSILLWALLLGTRIMTLVVLLISSTCVIWSRKDWREDWGRGALGFGDTGVVRGATEESRVTLTTDDALKGAEGRGRSVT